MARIRADFCVIGAGAAGLSFAAGAAAFGRTVVLIERGAMGGDCLNTGCVPSKALIAAARHAHVIRQAGDFGIRTTPPMVDFAAVMRHVHQTIEAIAPNDSVERFERLGVQVLSAEARFAAPDRVVAGGHEIVARRFILATGARPFVPDVPGLETVPYLTSETVFGLVELPSHLMIIGGGPMGLELAQAFRRLGSAVTVVEAGVILPREDRAAADLVRKSLEAEGVDICAGTKVLQVSETDGAVMMALSDGRTIAGSHILLATGRRPNLEGLDLEKAGIAVSAGRLVLDGRLQTSNARVMAIGDVGGGPQFTHAAGEQAGRALARGLFRLRPKFRADLLPRVTFTDPEIASVGLSLDDALQTDPRARAIRVPFAENDRAHAERRLDGALTLVIGKRGRLLGATLVGPGAGDMIGLYALAIGRGLGVSALRNLLLPYPTFSEVGKRAAITYYEPLARHWLIRGLVRALALFG